MRALVPFSYRRWACILILALGLASCRYGYQYYADPLRPLDEEGQAAGMIVSDDGTVTYVADRLEISVRPFSDGELNRLFPAQPLQGTESTNPYTFGNWRDPSTGTTPRRFTVFQLKVKNYQYPKILIDPAKSGIISDNGRHYPALSQTDMEEYYRKYITGYVGQLYTTFQGRKDLLSRTLYPNGVVFSGQEVEGFLAFADLHPEVRKVRLRLGDIALRFNFRDEPIETIDIEYAFDREIGYYYPRGEREPIKN